MTEIRTGRLFPWRRWSALAGLVLLLGSGIPGGGVPASARPEDRWYAFITDHDPRQFWTLLYTADDMLADGGKFRIYMDARGILLAITGSTLTQKDYMAIRKRRPGLELLVCKETLQRLLAGLKGRRIPPLLPGVRVVPCNGILSTLDQEGWRRAPGFSF